MYLRPVRVLGRKIRKQHVQDQGPKPISQSPSHQGAGAGPLVYLVSARKAEEARAGWRESSEPFPTALPSSCLDWATSARELATSPPPKDILDTGHHPSPGLGLHWENSEALG